MSKNYPYEMACGKQKSTIYQAEKVVEMLLNMFRKQLGYRYWGRTLVKSEKPDSI